MSILDDAKQLVHGDRNNAYGHPLQDFERIAALWEPILLTSVTAEQVGLCMIAVKLAREVHGHTKDTLIDIAGYAETLQMIADQREEDKCSASGVDTPLVTSEDNSSVSPVTTSIQDVVKAPLAIPLGTCPDCGMFLPHQHQTVHKCPESVEEMVRDGMEGL